MARRFTNTKHFHISRLLSEHIRFMAPGEVLPTVEELRNRYNASQATISSALDRLRSQGLIERPSGRKRLVVARIGSRPLFRVTLVRPLWSSPDYDAILNAIYELGHTEHFGFNVYTYSSIEALNIEHALRDSDAGLIIGDLNTPKEQIAAFNGCRKPIIFLRDRPEEVRASSVWVDDQAVGQLATNYLLKLGHKNILVLLSEPTNLSSTRRLQGWKSAMLKSGVKDVTRLIADCSVPFGKDAIRGSYERFSALLASDSLEFTAVFCVSWTGALAAMRALRESGKAIPEDVSIITYSSEAAFSDFLNPSLTTVETELKHYAREALQLVRNSLKNELARTQVEHVLLDPFLSERGSTAPPPSAAGTKRGADHNGSRSPAARRRKTPEP